jgi:hypothetical protein
MPTARYGLAAVTAPNGRIYAIGGFTNEQALPTVEEYDPVTNVWKARAPMPTARGALVAAMASNGKIYAISGYGQGVLAIVEEYDPTTDSWATSIPAMPTARFAGAAATASNGRIYVIGGSQHDLTDLTTVEEFTPPVHDSVVDNGSWSNSSRYSATYDFTALIPRGTYTVTVSNAVGVDGTRIAPNSSAAFTVDYAGYINDTTPPLIPSVTACAGSTADTLTAHWIAADPDSSIDLYQYAIGTTAGGTEVVNWTFTSDMEMTRSDLALLSGHTYYVSVKARNEGGLWSNSVSVGVEAGSGSCETNHTQSYVYLPLVVRQ